MTLMHEQFKVSYEFGGIYEPYPKIEEEEGKYFSFDFTNCNKKNQYWDK